MAVLDDIIVGVREDMAARQSRLGLSDLLQQVPHLPATLDPRPSFRAPGVQVIAEVKRSSPSKGSLADIPDPAALAEAYAAGGAAAISVLTEERRFSGSLADLVAVRARVDVPVLRKDFIVDDYQLAEARVAGADLALLIVAALSDEQLRDLMDTAAALDLTVLVEAHNEAEVERALAADAELIGINNRNLKTLDVDPMTFSRLAPLVPESAIRVAESGVRNPDDVAALAADGADVVLVGEALVTGGTPEAAVRAMLAAGR